MQPPEDARHLGRLPEATTEPYVAVLVKRYKYISLVLRSQVEGRDENAIVLTLHQNEAKTLAATLLDVAAAPAREDFIDESWHGVGGVFLGGPPRRDQLIEFSLSAVQRRPSDNE